MMPGAPRMQHAWAALVDRAREPGLAGGPQPLRLFLSHPTRTNRPASRSLRTDPLGNTSPFMTI